jgi:hypothetical protein
MTLGKDGGFSMIDGYLMIFEGPTAYDSKRCQKLACREVNTVEPAMPTFLWWSRFVITRMDHPESIPKPGRHPLVVDPIVSTKPLTKVLMDGDNSLNIKYAETLDTSWSRIQPTRAPFHGIVLGK